MHESYKLEEAEYFLKQMASVSKDHLAYKHNLSAFISAARSVLQFVRKEAVLKTGGQEWYDSQVASAPLIAFFKDQRDVNIHREPVRPIKETRSASKVTVSEVYRFTEWKGPEDIPTLCALYLDALRKIVHDGEKQGYLMTTGPDPNARWKTS